MSSQPQLLVTHDSSFHTDDVFACAALQLYLEKAGQTYTVMRSRNPEIIDEADYVFDTGSVYDPTKRRFDHHQADGAGKRSNGIPYAAFGLVWKHFGSDVCESDEIANTIDEMLVQPIDASDNGVDLYDLKIDNIGPFAIQSIIGMQNSTWQEPETNDENFTAAVAMAKKILARAITVEQHNFTAQEIAARAYKSTDDKQIVIVDQTLGRRVLQSVFVEYPEPIYFVYPNKKGAWRVTAVRQDANSFESRKALPESWRGLRDQELTDATGVTGVVFCHNSGFLAATETKEAAIELAKIALAS